MILQSLIAERTKGLMKKTKYEIFYARLNHFRWSPKPCTENISRADTLTQ